MKRLFIFIGSFIITAILLSIPALTALSFVLNWDNFIKFILTILAGIEFILASTFIGIKTELMEDY